MYLFSPKSINNIGLLICIATLSLSTLNAQGEGENWFFGNHSGLNFSSGLPVPISGSLDTIEGCASYSDVTGSLLFYSDGITVWDKNGTPMPNGQNLRGHPSSTQSAIIVPYPGKASLYYIFTVSTRIEDVLSEGFHSYLVDMEANNGLGDVIEETNLSQDLSLFWSEKVASVVGGACNTFWVLTVVNNLFYAYKIDENGLDSTPVISEVPKYHLDKRGYLKIAPNGKLIASASQGYEEEYYEFPILRGDLRLYDFNDLTGEVTEKEVLIADTRVDGNPYGVEFSEQSNRLYCSTLVTIDEELEHYKNRVYQFDLMTTEATISETKTLINEKKAFRGALQLAPNGKIYVATPISYEEGVNYLDVINSPNELGANCNYQEQAVTLQNKVMQGLPPFLTSIFVPIEITDGEINNVNNGVVKRCLGDQGVLTINNVQGLYKASWYKGDQLLGSGLSLNLGKVTSEMAGDYTIEIRYNDECGKSVYSNGKVTLKVSPYPTLPTTVSAIKQCDNDEKNDGFFEFDFLSKTQEILKTQSVQEFEVRYFKSEKEAQDFDPDDSKEIKIPYTNQKAFTEETIYYRIHNSDNYNCYRIGNFKMSVFKIPSPPETIKKMTVCDGTSYGTDNDGREEFDLTSKNTELLNGFSASNFTIVYYSDSDYSKTISKPSAYVNSTRSETIYVSIYNRNSSTCKENRSFDLEVLKLPNLITNTYTLTQCDEDGVLDGYTSFNLENANSFLSSDEDLTITYHSTLKDAQEETNKLNSYPFSNKTQAKVYARIESANGCLRTAEITLKVLETQLPATFEPLTMVLCDDAPEGFLSFDLATNDQTYKDKFPSGEDLTVTYFKSKTHALYKINPLSSPYTNETAYNQTLWVRIESGSSNACYGVGPFLKLVVNPKPTFELDSEAYFCTNLGTVTLTPKNVAGDFNTYEWTDEQGIVLSKEMYLRTQKIGDYTLKITSPKGCSSDAQTVTLIPSINAQLTVDALIISDDSTNNSIEILVSKLGYGNYEYALNDQNYQDEPFFEQVPIGIHTLFVRDKKGCGTNQIAISVIGFPKYFTPNNDGVNDYWGVKGLLDEFHKEVKIYIYDRFGKEVFSSTKDNLLWDGYYNGVLLMETDYWFFVEIEDYKGEVRKRDGHFSLIRR